MTNNADTALRSKPIGERLVQFGYITREQLACTLEYQKEHPGFIGELLVAQGYLSQEKLLEFLRNNTVVRLGERLILDYGLTREQLNHALEYQKAHGGRLGSICVQMGYLTEQELSRALALNNTQHSLLGDELVSRGLITQQQLEKALELQKRSGGRLGEILVSLGMIKEADLYRILANHQTMGRPGTDAAPEEVPILPFEMALRLHAVLIRDEKNYSMIAVEQQLDANDIQEIEQFTGKKAEQVLVSPTEFFSLWELHYKGRESEQSVFGLYENHPENSAIVTFTTGQIITMLSLLIFACISLAAFREKMLLIIMIVLQMIYMLMALAKFYFVIRGASKDAQLKFSPEEIAAIDENELPVYTVLIPVYKEREVIAHLLDRMNNMDYPKHKLDIRILLEEDDTETIEFVRQMNLPSYFTPIVVPYSMPKTKPKACNYGLIGSRGEYLVIYDAEDRPEPDQLKKAYLAFKKLPDEFVCIQAKLNYFNSSQNWLTKLFTQEYSMWFELLLVGIMQVDIPIPLGGTSNHFRTAFLKEVGGWDPFNVTEDADLGIRLNKYHYKTAVLDSRTWEEANSNLRNWIRQRSRWIKGYMQTFFVHMRNPIRFMRTLGFKGTLGYLAMIFGTPFMPLINPIFWALLVIWLLFEPFWVQQMFPGALYYIATIHLVFSNFIFVYMNLVGSYYVIRDCALKHQQPFSYSMLRYALLTPLYWVFMSVAAYKALFQLFAKPFYWEKTNHGLTTGKPAKSGTKSK